LSYVITACLLPPPRLYSRCCHPLAHRTQLKFLSYNPDFWAARKKLATEKRVVDEI
jgi:hypothetical protein